MIFLESNSNKLVGENHLGSVRILANSIPGHLIFP